MDIKYIGMDVHKETISIAVMKGDGKLVMESIIETKSSTILQFIEGVRGDLQVTVEEGTWAAWLYDLLKPHVTELVVCDPRKNALMKQGNKSDKIDARKLADLLRGGYLRSVYHGENGLRTLKELARSYLAISKDLTRVMNRVKALYRSWGIFCGGQQVYAPRHRSEWLNKIGEAGVRRRAEFFYQQLDALRALRQAVRRDLLAESRKHGATKLLRQIPYTFPRCRATGEAARGTGADLELCAHAEQRLWRTVMRRKYQLTRNRVQLQNRVESLLEEGQIKLSSLVSDLLGASARRMLKALAEGETDPAVLAALADRKLRATQEQLSDALGACTELNPVYRRLLKMMLRELQLIEEQIGQLDQEMASLLSHHQDAVKRLAEMPGLGVDSA